jgi:phage terminase large subunit-like protein
LPIERRLDFRGLVCALGVDLSQGDDFCAFTFLFPLRNGAFGVKTRSYITQRTFDSLPSAMRFKYEQFLDEGSLIIMDANVLDMIDVFDDLDAHIIAMEYDVRTLGFDPYNAKEFINRWEQENGPYNLEKVIQGARTESVPLGELKKLSEAEMLLFDEQLMGFAMGNAITLEDTNGNRKLLKRRHEEKIDNVAALMDAWVAFKLHKEDFE